jgi:hypothetical protein
MENVDLFYGHLGYLQPFGIHCGHLVYFYGFGIMYLEKSGNHGPYLRAGDIFSQRSKCRPIWSPRSRPEIWFTVEIEAIQIIIGTYEFYYQSSSRRLRAGLRGACRGPARQGRGRDEPE